MTPAGAALPLAEYLARVLARIQPLPPLDLDLTQAYGSALAADVTAPNPLPAFDHAAIDGYALRAGDVSQARPDRPVRLNVVGDIGVTSWRPVRVPPGGCFSIAAGAALPAGADAVAHPSWTDQGMVALEVRTAPQRGHAVRRAGDQMAAGATLAKAGTYVTPALVALLAATGVGHVVVRPQPRVAVVATGDELVDTGRSSQPGQVVDANSHALAAAAADTGAHAYRIGICDDDPEAMRTVLDDQTLRSDLIITTGGTAHGPGDMARRILGRDGAVEFTEVSVYPQMAMGFGAVGPEEVPIVCLPGDPGAALIGFEVLARPLILRLAGADPVFRPSVKAHLLETVTSPAGLREFRPAHVAERRGGGYTLLPLVGGQHTLSGLAEANGLLVLGEKVSNAAAGSTVDVLLMDRRR
ncbi:MAG: molybdopterin molybdotransferase MoeA [Micromonosporaceae bacterium]